MSIYRVASNLRRAAGLLACILAFGLWPGAVNGAEPTDEEVRHFKALVKEGSKLREAGESREALAKLEEALDIVDHPKLAFTVGQLHQEIGACEQAKQVYTDVLARPRLPDSLRVEVVEQLKAVDACESFGTLSLTCTPAHATVQMGSEPLGCPARYEVRPGKFEVIVSAPEYVDEEVSGSIEAGELVERRVQLRQGGDGAGAEVEVDAAPTPWLKYGAYGSMGVGAALLAGGIASDYTARSRAEELVEANRDGDRDRAQALKGEGESAEVRTLVLYSAGAVFIAGGVTLWAVEASGEGDDAAVRGEVVWGASGPTVRGVLSW
jgi:hypothetical protein